jgi:V8-like Glu-specific endopeptidase
MDMKNTLVAITIFYCISASAIVVRHDVDSKLYSENEKNHPALFPLFDDGSIKECVATLIDAEWAITAAHCTILISSQNLKKNPYEVKISGIKNSITKVFIPEKYGQIKPIYNDSEELIDVQGIEDESYDVALLKLGTTVTHVTPLSLYKKSDEKGKEIIILGWGDFGKGDSGIISSEPTNDGTFRSAQNRINEVDGNFLIFDFDSPNSKEVLPFEGVAGPGDSGGPALVKNGNQFEIIGISSGGGYPDDSADNNQNDGRYGWIEYYIRTSKIQNWINSILSKNG